jgi:hypothetical protein
METVIDRAGHTLYVASSLVMFNFVGMYGFRRRKPALQIYAL